VCSAAICRARGQVLRSSAGASASIFPIASRGSSARGAPRTPTRSRFFFCASNLCLKPLNSINVQAAGSRMLAVTVLPGAVTSLVTAKSLFRDGLRGLLPCYPSGRALHICGRARAYAPVSLSIHSNIGNREDYPYCSVASLFRALLLGGAEGGNTVTSGAGIGGALGGGSAGRNIIRGGYSVGAVQLLDLRWFAGGARRKFQASGRVAWAIGPARSSAWSRAGMADFCGFAGWPERLLEPARWNDRPMSLFALAFCRRVVSLLGWRAAASWRPPERPRHPPQSARPIPLHLGTAGFLSLERASRSCLHRSEIEGLPNPHHAKRGQGFKVQLSA
jgi:hypothetical protein